MVNTWINIKFVPLAVSLSAKLQTFCPCDRLLPKNCPCSRVVLVTI